MDTKYYKKWVRIKKAPAMPLSDEEARQLHNAHKSYVAVLSKLGKPHYVVDLAADWVTVDFLDDLARVYLSYDFREMRDGELFLTGVIHREFAAHSEDAISSTLFKFELTGEIFMERRDHLNSVVEERETKADPTTNWERFPDFGNYTALCKANR